MTNSPAPVVTLTGLDDFNLARWKPLSGDKFLEEMLAVGFSKPERVIVPTENTELADGRDQMVIFAEVMSFPERTVSHEPYLTIFHDSDSSSRPTAFVRTDVLLASEADEPRTQRPAGRSLQR